MGKITGFISGLQKAIPNPKQVGNFLRSGGRSNAKVAPEPQGLSARANRTAEGAQRPRANTLNRPSPSVQAAAAAAAPSVPSGPKTYAISYDGALEKLADTFGEGSGKFEAGKSVAAKLAFIHGDKAALEHFMNQGIKELGREQYFPSYMSHAQAQEEHATRVSYNDFRVDAHTIQQEHNEYASKRIEETADKFTQQALNAAAVDARPPRRARGDAAGAPQRPSAGKPEAAAAGAPPAPPSDLAAALLMQQIPNAHPAVQQVVAHIIDKLRTDNPAAARYFIENNLAQQIDRMAASGKFKGNSAADVEKVFTEVAVERAAAQAAAAGPARPAAQAPSTSFYPSMATPPQR